MFGDDLNATVMTERIGIGTLSDAREGCEKSVERVKWSDKRESKTRLDSDQSTKARGERGNYERTTSLRKHADAMRMMR